MQRIPLAACVAALLVGAATLSPADEGGPHFTFGAATSYVFDLNRPDSQVTGENRRLYSDGRSENSFNIDLAQLGIQGSRSRVSYGAKADFGDWARAVEDDIHHAVALQEMFLAIDAGFGVISAGRMPTPLGYEQVEPWANANISRSRAWYFQSISHDGAAVSGDVGGVSLMGAVINGLHINGKDANNPDDQYGGIASASVPVGDADLRVTAAYSDEQDKMRYVEVNGLLSGKTGPWRYGLEGTWLDGNGHGSKVPAPVDLSVGDVTGYSGATFGNWSGDLRLSYTHQKGTDAAFSNRNREGIVSFTATGGFRIVDGVVVRAEYRIDTANQDIFDDHNSLATVAGPAGQRDLVQVVSVQLMWTPTFGQK